LFTRRLDGKAVRLQPQAQVTASSTDTGDIVCLDGQATDTGRPNDHETEECQMLRLAAPALGASFAVAVFTKPSKLDGTSLSFKPADGVWGAIESTPLIELSSLSAATGCRILCKAENMNPGGSVKDRAARNMIAAAEANGDLKPGGLVVEATGGNTGVALAMLCKARGYRVRGPVWTFKPRSVPFLSLSIRLVLL
jgi:hypothetical protein